MWKTTVSKTVMDDSGDEILYTFSAQADTQEKSEYLALLYVSMVEYGMVAQKYAPKEMAFPKEQLYQFIQRNTLDMLESMYPDVVETAYQNAYAYVQSYIGAMFDVDAMLAEGGMSSTVLTLRLALCISTVTYILASSPQNADTIAMHNQQLHMLLRGLKNGSRNMGKNGIAGEPNVRMSVVKLSKTGYKP